MHSPGRGINTRVSWLTVLFAIHQSTDWPHIESLAIPNLAGRYVVALSKANEQVIDQQKGGSDSMGEKRYQYGSVENFVMIAKP